MNHRALKNCTLLAALLAVVLTGCAAARSTALKSLEAPPGNLKTSITVAAIRDVSRDAVASGFLNPEKLEIDLSEPARLELGHLLQDCGCFQRVQILPEGEIPSDATEMTCISLARRENTDYVIHGEINHRASFTLNWLTWPSYIPGLVVLAPLWSPNYTLKAVVELTLHLLDARTLERILTRKFSEEAYTTICFLTRFTALHDRFVELEKEVALHNASVDAANALLPVIADSGGGENRKLEPTGKVVAIADFEAANSFVERMGYGKTAADKFATVLEKSGVFEVVERQRLGDLLAERNLSMTDLVQPEKAGQVTRLLGIDYLLVGSVARVGARLELSVRMLDVKNGKIVFAESDGVKRDADMQILVEQLARKIMKSFCELHQRSGKE